MKPESPSHPQYQPLAPILRQIIQSMSPSVFWKKQLNTIVPSTPRSCKWSLFLRFSHQNLACISSLNACYMPHPYHSSWFDHPNNIWWGVQIMTFDNEKCRCRDIYIAVQGTKYCFVYKVYFALYWGAGKSFAQPGRKQAGKHVRNARDLNNIETRAVNQFLFLQGKGAKGNSRHSYRNISLLPSWSG